MTVPDLQEKVVALRTRLTALGGRKWCVALVVISCAYVASYVVLEHSAAYRREVDFFSNSGRSWVQLGSMRFSPEGWQSFMGSVYHPALFVVLALPAALLGVLLLSAGLALILGAVASTMDRKSEERRQREQRAFQLDRERIEAEKRRPMVVGGGAVVGPAAIRRLCAVCDSDVDGSGGGCPNCGAPWVQG